MTPRRALVASLALLLIVLVWFLWPRHDDPAGSRSSDSRSEISDLKSQIPPSVPEPRSTLADALNAPGGDIHADLRIVLEVIDTFRTNFPRAGNPVGDNPEITAALTGKNKLRLALIPPDHRAIDRAGELCDRWGTPFFFHAESATRMEIRSAGPDRKMWSADDVVLAP
jgi:hypothetical protein